MLLRIAVILILLIAPAFADDAAQKAFGIHPPSERQMILTRQKLDDVLARREFRQAAITQNIFERIMLAIADLLRSLFQSVQNLGFSAATIIYVVLIAILGAMIFLLINHLRRALTEGATTKAAAQDDKRQPRRIQSSAEWMQLAEHHHQNGESKEALRCAYLGLLRRMHELNAVQLQSGQTNWEILRQLRTSPYHAAILDATRIFESRMYAMSPAQPEDFNKLKSHFAATS